MRSAKELVVASRKFAREQRWRSWWCLWSTLGLLATLMALAANDDWAWPVRIACGFLGGLTLVRLFTIFHDQQHGTILRGSLLADIVMRAFGLLCLTPASVWKSSHDLHHQHNSREFNPNIGSFPLMTVAGYASASFPQRLGYRLSRHPLTLALGYLTVFACKMCLIPLFTDPRRHWDCALAIVCHLGFAWFVFRDWDGILLGWVLPLAVGCSVGSYLFFAQHNFPGVRLVPQENWNYVNSALHSSSYLSTGPVLRWFTGNIGYHHVHHLNAKIPFYRLPEAMAALQELQSPPTTSLSLRDIAACLRLKLWDPAAGRLVNWSLR
ncbi:MAG: fatty acid desaturase [Pirellulaceae bacterium]|nr:fatty acid desaturase [Pirellulaceae bacterium]